MSLKTMLVDLSIPLPTIYYYQKSIIPILPQAS
jgi:hypothetical protein